MPGEAASRLRSVEAVQGQGPSMADASREPGISGVTRFPRRTECRGIKGRRLQHLDGLHKEAGPRRRAEFDLAPDAPFPAVTGRSTRRVPRAACGVSTMSVAGAGAWQGIGVPRQPGSSGRPVNTPSATTWPTRALAVGASPRAACARPDR